MNDDATNAAPSAGPLKVPELTSRARPTLEVSTPAWAGPFKVPTLTSRALPKLAAQAGPSLEIPTLTSGARSTFEVPVLTARAGPSFEEAAGVSPLLKFPSLKTPSLEFPTLTAQLGPSPEVPTLTPRSGLLLEFPALTARTSMRPLSAHVNAKVEVPQTAVSAPGLKRDLSSLEPPQVATTPLVPGHAAPFNAPGSIKRARFDLNRNEAEREVKVPRARRNTARSTVFIPETNWHPMMWLDLEQLLARLKTENCSIKEANEEVARYFYWLSEEEVAERIATYAEWYVAHAECDAREASKERKRSFCLIN